MEGRQDKAYVDEEWSEVFDLIFQTAYKIYIYIYLIFTEFWAHFDNKIMFFRGDIFFWRLLWFWNDNTLTIGYNLEKRCNFIILGKIVPRIRLHFRKSDGLCSTHFMCRNLLAVCRCGICDQKIFWKGQKALTVRDHTNAEDIWAQESQYGGPGLLTAFGHAKVEDNFGKISILQVFI